MMAELPSAARRQAAVAFLKQLGDFISGCCLSVAASSLLAIVALCGTNVVRRYFFGLAWSWAEELMLHLMVVIVFMGAAAVTWSGRHLRVEAIVEFFPGYFRTAAIYATALLMTAFLAFLASISFQVIQLLYRFNQTSNALEIPLWIPHSVVGLGFVLIAFFSLLRLVVFNDAGMSVVEAEAEQNQ